MFSPISNVDFKILRKTIHINSYINISTLPILNWVCRFENIKEKLGNYQNIQNGSSRERDRALFI